MVSLLSGGTYFDYVIDSWPQQGQYEASQIALERLIRVLIKQFNAHLSKTKAFIERKGLSSELGVFDRGQGLVYANSSCSFFSTHFIIMIFPWDK